jgi:hypothetical protein
MPSDWERITEDPALLSDARRRYRGRGDVADQLWWLQHPGTDAPSGAPDPKLLLRTARRGLYRRNPVLADAAAVARQQEQEDADRELARRAVSEAVDARWADAAPVGTPVVPKDRPGASFRRTPLVGGRLLVTLVVAAALVLTGVLLGRASSPGVGVNASSGRAYEVLDRQQRPLDRIPDDIRPGFVRSTSTRAIAHYWSIGTDVYAARADGGRICLVTVVLGTRSASSCTTDAAFTMAGLFLQVEAAADPVDDSGRVPLDQIGLLWLKDGTLTISV